MYFIEGCYGTRQHLVLVTARYSFFDAELGDATPHLSDRSLVSDDDGGGPRLISDQ